MGGTINPAGPPAEGVRPGWRDLPARLREAVEGWLESPIVTATSQRSGFSPGLAARLVTASGKRAFLKAVGPLPNPTSPSFHRREGQIVAALPASAPAPRLLWSYDEGETGWVALGFEDVEGSHPVLPWQRLELDRVMGAVAALSDALTPSPLPAAQVGHFEDAGLVGWWTRAYDQPPSGLDDWSTRHLKALADLEQSALTAAAGNTLLHLDLRADNILLSADRVWVVDWPHARLGAAWVDVVLMAPSVGMQAGPLPEELLRHQPSFTSADADAVTAVVAAAAGFFIWHSLQPPPPGLPTLRPFQAAQGEVARAWLARRTGWAS